MKNSNIFIVKIEEVKESVWLVGIFIKLFEKKTTRIRYIKVYIDKFVMLVRILS